MRFTLHVFALAVVGLALAARPAFADDIRVTVLAVLATAAKDAPVEKELIALAEAVRRTYPELVGFQRGKMINQPIAVGKEETFVMVDDESVTILVCQGMDKKDRVRVKVKPPGLSEVTINCCCGKFVPFVTPYETRGKKERLIIAVMVNPCP